MTATTKKGRLDSSLNGNGAPQKTPTKKWESVYMLRNLKLDQLLIDESYQRGEQMIIEHIGRNFDPEVCGLIWVAERPGKRYYVVDGQQRCAGARMAGYKAIDCAVFKSKGPEHEASIYQQMNLFRKKPTPFDIFKASLAAGDEQAVAMSRIVHDLEFDFHVGGSTKVVWPKLGGLRELTSLHKKALLRPTLSLIRDAWPKQDDACKVEFYLGVSSFLVDLGNRRNEKDRELNEERVLANLTSLSAFDLTTAARTYCVRKKIKVGRINIITALSQRLMTEYRKKISK